MAQRDLPQNGSERLDSIPALLARNVARNGALPAYREKEFGIWQSWTWAQAADEIQALALGFLSLGLARGDYVAVIGRNRPMHYWSMLAAQMGVVTNALLKYAPSAASWSMLGVCMISFPA